MTTPDWSFESQLRARGAWRVAGVDEAGRGAWAGPVTVAAVILPASLPDPPYRDSKALSPQRREELAAHVRAHALCWAVEHAPPEEVDRLNVLGATHAAAARALARLDPAPQGLVTDYLRLATPLPLLAPAHADALSYSVAAASLLAKTARDRLMTELDAEYPGYGFAAHKGYGAPLHREALARLGLCPAHRRSFRPVREVTEQAALFG